MRNLTGVLQVSVHILICMAILMLGYAEGKLFPYFATLPIAVYSMFGTKRWPRIQLPTGIANILGLLAFGLAAKGLFSANIESRLLAGAHLLIYLTWIVLLQAKKYAQYWWLFALAVLQIAVGAILTSNGLFGVMLILFLFTAIWTLTIFSLHQAGQRFAPAETSDLINQPGGAPAAAAAPVVVAPPKPPERPLLQSSSTMGSIETEDTDRWFNTRFAFGIAGMTTAALVIAMFFFLFIPRRWIGRQAWASAISSSEKNQQVGFADTVQLGDIGKILESNERVMEIRMFDNDTGTPIDIETYSAELGYDEPLFRGQVLDSYENGIWKRTRIRRTQTHDVPGEPTPGLVRQEIRLAPIGTNVLFSMQPVPIRLVPAARLSDQSDRPAVTSPIRFRPIGAVLLRNPNTSQRKRVLYEVFTRKKEEARRDVTFGGRKFDESSAFRFKQYPKEKLVRLKAEAARIAGVGEGGRPNRRKMAERLVSHLRDTGGFSYSLNTKRENYSIDPVEEFLERKTGHCEYFASALALMLRAVEIPARIVSGFKGGTENQITGYYEIEQRHAHAWVEAFIDGHWFVLDATPADERQQSVDGMNHSLRTWQDVVNFISDVWNLYVVDINIGSQRKKLYDPVKNSATDAWKAMTGGQGGASSRLQALKAFLMNPKMWFSWRGGLIAFVLMLTLSGIVWSIRKLVAFVRRFEFQRESQHNLRQMHIKFYERFREVCAQLGLVRPAWQTHREFACEVSARLKRERPDVGPAESMKMLSHDVPLDLAETFYGVRFGDQPLTEQRAAEIDRELSEWERLVKSAPETPAGAK